MPFQTGVIAVRLLDAAGVTPLMGVAVRVTPDVPFHDEDGTRAGIMAGDVLAGYAFDGTNFVGADGVAVSASGGVVAGVWSAWVDCPAGRTQG